MTEALSAIQPLAAQAPTRATSQTDELRERAIQLEAFLFEELLRASGTSSPTALGAQNSQFESFLRRSQAEAVAGAGQTGLADAIYRALARSQNPNGSA